MHYLLTRKKSERNWVFATNANFMIPKSQQPDDAYLSYFNYIQYYIIWSIFIVWNIYGLRYLILKKFGFKNPSLWQKLSSFTEGTKRQYQICHWISMFIGTSCIFQIKGVHSKSGITIFLWRFNLNYVNSPSKSFVLGLLILLML